MPEFNFSIIVCAYNPDSRCLKRLLESIRAMILEAEKKIEIIIIDNNSSPPLYSTPLLKNFLNQFPDAQCIIEEKQGLTNARCRAIEQIRAPIAVFFDDDNEPNPDYLITLEKYFKKYPNVGIWGPGTITVEYLDPVTDWFFDNQNYYQKRNAEFGYICVPKTWDKYHPSGTGFAVRQTILSRYSHEVRANVLKSQDRNGKNLSSAGDVQIVWEGIKLGYACGVIPELVCNHLINKSKANLNYLKRLRFGTASSYLPALFESYPQTTAEAYNIPKMYEILKIVFKHYIKLIIKQKRSEEDELKLADYIGSLYGTALATNSKKQFYLLTIAKHLQLI